jgi:hypothetical protein
MRIIMEDFGCFQPGPFLCKSIKKVSYSAYIGTICNQLTGRKKPIIVERNWFKQKVMA